VDSLHARKALLASLDLIPPGFTFEAATAALLAAPEHSRLPLLPTIPYSLFGSMPSPPSHKQQGASKSSSSNSRAAKASRQGTTATTTESTAPAPGHVQQGRRPWPAPTGRLTAFDYLFSGDGGASGSAEDEAAAPLANLAAAAPAAASPNQPSAKDHRKGSPASNEQLKRAERPPSLGASSKGRRKCGR
jgi:hypothetical protein